MRPLDPLLTSPLRLGIVSLLIKLKSASFVFLKEELKASQGNLSVQLDKLNQAGYITIAKSFSKNYPKTTCTISDKGIKAFEDHVKALKEYLHL
ncbi:MAG: winged helix-turn-helix domain-containing protein [Flavobacteriaceae bacterium]